MHVYSVIIRCYNEEEHIGRLLSGVLEQSVRPREIILVDSGSTDATLSIASHFPVKIVTIKKEEFSFGRSLNRGCRAAGSDIIMIVSGHVYPVYKNWAESMLAPFDDEKTGLVYGKQRAAAQARFSEKRILIKWFPETAPEKQTHPFCNNANAAIRRSLWEQIPYDEELTGLEDLDWAKKISAEGFEIVYQSGATVIHTHQESYRRIFDRYYREAFALKKVYPEEKIGRREFLRLWASNVFADCRAAVREKIFLKNVEDIVLFRWMQFWGTYRGFNDGYVKMSHLKNRFYYPGEKILMPRQDTAEAMEHLKINYADLIKPGGNHADRSRH